MRITALDIRKHGFRKKVSGYDRQEVDAFLSLVADDYESLVREADGLRARVAQLEARVGELSESETVLRDTLTMAHQVSEDLKRTAVKESELLIGEAEVKGEKILAAAHQRASKLAEDIRELKQLRTRLAAAVRATIETHLSLLEGLLDDDPLEAAPRLPDGRA